MLNLLSAGYAFVYVADIGNAVVGVEYEANYKLPTIIDKIGKIGYKTHGLHQHLGDKYHTFLSGM